MKTLDEEVVSCNALQTANQLPFLVRMLEHGTLDRVVITDMGEPLAVMVSAAEYDRLVGDGS